MSLLDTLLAADPAGKALLDCDAADLAAGVTWGLYDGDRLLCTSPAYYIAELERDDCADASDRPVSSFCIREVDVERVAA